LIELTLQ